MSKWISPFISGFRPMLRIKNEATCAARRISLVSPSLLAPDRFQQRNRVDKMVVEYALGNF